MGKLTQKELLKTEAFSDIIRGVATTVKALSPEITEPLRRVTEPFRKGFLENPLAFLKENLRRNKKVQFVKFLKQTKKQADRTKPWYRRIVGPKSVTIIEFIGNVYTDEPDDSGKPIRGYRGYGMTNPGSPAAAAQYDSPTAFDRQERKPFANLFSSVDNTGKNVIIEDNKPVKKLRYGRRKFKRKPSVKDPQEEEQNTSIIPRPNTSIIPRPNTSIIPRRSDAQDADWEVVDDDPDTELTIYNPRTPRITPGNPRLPAPDTPEPEPAAEPEEQKKLVAIIFRTKEGLYLQGVYDSETNQKIEGGSTSSGHKKPKAADTLKRLDDKEVKKRALLTSDDLEDFVKDKFGLDDNDISSSTYRPVKDAITARDKKELVRALKRVGLVENVNQLTTLQKLQLWAENIKRGS